uniref:Uncharacterized protein n=1 Tax=Arundo donax TaxID=35708 RepID=A0A0A9CNR8_ARUDO
MGCSEIRILICSHQKHLSGLCSSNLIIEIPHI